MNLFPSQVRGLWSEDSSRPMHTACVPDKIYRNLLFMMKLSEMRLKLSVGFARLARLAFGFWDRAGRDGGRQTTNAYTNGAGM